MRVDDGAEQLFFVTTFMRGRGNQIDGTEVRWTGTAFLYGVITNKGLKTFVVSNRHVMLGGTDVRCTLLQCTFITVNPHTNQPELGKALVSDIDPTNVIAHPDSLVDIAVIPYRCIERAFAHNNSLPFVRIVGPELLLDEADLVRQIRAIDDALFIGYPSGIYDTTNLTPVARRAMTATPLTLDYQGKPAYLIDAAVFEGSSGSPVFFYGQPPQLPGEPIRIGGGNRILFAGVLAAVHTRQRVATIVTVPTALAAISSEGLGLGVVFKPRAVDECVDVALQAEGLRRE